MIEILNSINGGLTINEQDEIIINISTFKEFSNCIEYISVSYSFPYVKLKHDKEENLFYVVAQGDYIKNGCLTTTEDFNTLLY